MIGTLPDGRAQAIHCLIPSQVLVVFHVTPPMLLKCCADFHGLAVRDRDAFVLGRQVVFRPQQALLVRHQNLRLQRADMTIQFVTTKLCTITERATAMPSSPMLAIGPYCVRSSVICAIMKSR